MADEAQNTPEAEQPEDSRPEWLPDKYANEEEFVKAYKSAENKIREQGESLAAIQSELEQYREAFATAQQPQQQQVDPYSMYEEDPLAATNALIDQRMSRIERLLQQQQQQTYQPIYQQQNEQLAYIADAQMGQQYEDWNDVKERVGEIIRENPILFPNEALGSLQGVTSALDNAYKLAKYESLNQQVDQLSASQAETARAMKLGAQTATGAAGRPDSPEENQQFLDALKDAYKPTRLSPRW